MNRWRFWWRYIRRDTPWDTRVTPPEVVALAAQIPPGRALDIGCGTGTSALYLAERGWQVTGVDFAAPAIRTARQRAMAARLGAAFHVADVANLSFLAPPFALIVDVGCLHGLSVDHRRGCIRHLKRLSAPDAILAMYAFAPRLMHGEQMGLAADEVAALFAPEFSMLQVVHGRDKGSGPASAWYTLQRAKGG